MIEQDSTNEILSYIVTHWARNIDTCHSARAHCHAVMRTLISFLDILFSTSDLCRGEWISYITHQSPLIYRYKRKLFMFPPCIRLMYIYINATGCVIAVRFNIVRFARLWWGGTNDRKRIFLWLTTKITWQQGYHCIPYTYRPVCVLHLVLL